MKEAITLNFSPLNTDGKPTEFNTHPRAKMLILPQSGILERKSHAKDLYLQDALREEL